jgi:hypothetical protein
MPALRDVIKGAKDIKAAISNELNQEQKQAFLQQVDEPEMQQQLRDFQMAKNVAQNAKDYLGNIAKIEGINAAAANPINLIDKSEKQRIEGMAKAFEKRMSDLLAANPLIEKQAKYAEKHDLINPEENNNNGWQAPAAEQQHEPEVQQQAAGWKPGSTGAALGPRLGQAQAGGPRVAIGGMRKP